MPDIRLKNQPFDIDFHSTEPVLYTGLLTGEVKAFRYDEVTGEPSTGWSVRPSKRTARALCVDGDGQSVWMAGKAGGLFQLNAEDGAMKKERVAHEVYCVNEGLVVTGDDDGVIKFWDPRQEDSIRSYTHHFDYISDFTYFDDKRQLITTSGDGHLSAIDIRSNKAEPLAISGDQEDELLSIAPIKGGKKCVVGSTLGILSVWNRKMGWGDCVDRIPGHPASVDAIVALTDDIVATGSEDGMVRVMQILPNKFYGEEGLHVFTYTETTNEPVGVIATHEEYPIERLAVDKAGKFLGSVSHDECIKLTDIEDLFEESDDEDGEGEGDSSDDDSDAEGAGDAAGRDSDSDSDAMEVDEAPVRARKGKDEEPGFYDDL